MPTEPSEEVRTVEVRVPVIRLPKLPTGERVELPQRQHVAELCNYLADHLYEYRDSLDAATFRQFLDEYVKYSLLARAGVQEYPIIIVEE